MDSPRQTTSTSGTGGPSGAGVSPVFEDLVTIGFAPSLWCVPGRRAAGVPAVCRIRVPAVCRTAFRPLPAALLTIDRAMARMLDSGKRYAQ
ncbi:hypothetical protein HOK021_63670 [Streptomyces hygroscopicus]|nr:hypothetical protein HOK021_63670 [Streptomyces hygroscopicus]